METIFANADVSQVRRVTLHGRNYLVAPMTLIVPGVLPGSEGPLYYPDEEVSANPDIWNGIPLTVYHPKDADGQHVSARSPEVLDTYGIGIVFNVGYLNDKLQGEAWFDEILTKAWDEKLDPQYRILPRLESGKPVSLSTGLFTQPVPTPGVDPKTGRSYNAVATQYRADHLAILPDEDGACSISDGCGVLVNGRQYYDIVTEEMLKALKEGESYHKEVINGKTVWGFTSPQKNDPTNDPILNEGETMKKTLIDWLVKNCSCWKDDREYLEKQTEEKLKSLKQQSVAAKITNAAKKGFNTLYKTVTNADGEGEVAGVDLKALAEFFGVQTDAAADPVGFIAELKSKVDEVSKKLGGAADAPAPTSEPTDGDVVPNSDPNMTDDDDEPKVTGNKRKLSVKQYLDNMPDDLRPIWNRMVKSDAQQKAAAITKLTAHLTGNAKTAAIAKLKMKKTDDLEEMVALLPSPTSNARPPVANPMDDDDFYEVRLPNFDRGGHQYDGAGGAPSPLGNAADDDILELPSMDYGNN